VTVRGVFSARSPKRWQGCPTLALRWDERPKPRWTFGPDGYRVGTSSPTTVTGDEASRVGTSAEDAPARWTALVSTAGRPRRRDAQWRPSRLQADPLDEDVEWMQARVLARCVGWSLHLRCGCADARGDRHRGARPLARAPRALIEDLARIDLGFAARRGATRNALDEQSAAELGVRAVHELAAPSRDATWSSTPACCRRRRSGGVTARPRCGSTRSGWVRSRRLPASS
jgi:hypothetical protein